VLASTAGDLERRSICRGERTVGHAGARRRRRQRCIWIRLE
jgi:hypothetical protein